MSKSALAVFEDFNIRRQYDEKTDTWYFSVVDVIHALTESPRPRKYWNALKTKLKEEGSELSQNLGQLKMQASDGKFYTTDVATPEQLLRLIQSVPSPKAESFNWITGYRKPKLENLQKIASATGKPISYFLDNTCGAVGNKNIVVSGKNNVVANNDIDLIKKELSEVKKQLHEMILIIKNKK